jgi:xanthosine utilization system XapX-like protein
MCVFVFFTCQPLPAPQLLDLKGILFEVWAWTKGEQLAKVILRLKESNPRAVSNPKEDSNPKAVSNPRRYKQ